jgi:dienelactone hydrolase
MIRFTGVKALGTVLIRVLHPGPAKVRRSFRRGFGRSRQRRRNAMVRLALVSLLLLDALALRAWAQPTSTEVTFRGAGEYELRGTLVLPAEAASGAGRAAAMLLLPGSGPTDRNGNQPPMVVTDLLIQIADRLAAEGVASLRFDKRAAHGYAAAWPADPAEHDGFFSYENFIADATAAYRFLRGDERIDDSRVAILGHSEGGLFALQIGHDLAESEERPAGLILAATAGRPLDIVLREQLTALLEQQTSDQVVRDEFLAHVERGIAAVKDKQPVPPDMPPGLRPIFNPGVQQLLYAYFTVDPAALAAKVRGPVLVIQGERDVQISAERDAPRLEEALRKRADGGAGGPDPVETVIIPGASHNFKKPASDTDPGFAGPVVPAALDRIAAWARDLLRAPSR